MNLICWEKPKKIRNSHLFSKEIDMPITKVTKDIEKVCKQYKALHTRNSDVFPKYLKSMNTVNKQFKKGHITAIEYFQKIDLLVLGLTKLGFGSRRFVNDEMEDLINLLNK